MYFPECRIVSRAVGNENKSLRYRCAIIAARFKKNCMSPKGCSLFYHCYFFRRTIRAIVARYGHETIDWLVSDSVV